MTITNKADNVRQINVVLEPSKSLDVGFYKNSRADITMSCTYIKSGQQEIQDYTDKVCKPDMDNYIIEKADNTFLPLLKEAQNYAQSAKDSVRECTDIVSGLNMEDIIAIEANNRSEADQAIEASLDAACQELDEKIAAKANKTAVYSKAENDLQLAAKADLESPQFSGTPTVPTPKEGAPELQSANLVAVKNKIAAGLSTNGLYQAITVSSTQWCREWFSDEAKTRRVWMEQWGKLVKNSNGGVNDYSITYLVPFSSLDYYFNRGQEHCYAGVIGTCYAWNGYYQKKTTGIRYLIDNDNAVTSFWFACGK